MPPVTILDARGNQVPLIRGPRRKEWPPHSYFGGKRAMEAAGEPWKTEWQAASEASGLHGGTIGFLAIAELAVFNLTLPQGLFGLSGQWTAGVLTILCSPLCRTLYPLFDRFSRRKNSRALTAAYLSAGRCPSCGATLSGDAGVGAERVCSACHAAWRAEPTATAAEPVRA